jgi:peptide/nickel transport system substrate-binding protein
VTRHAAALFLVLALAACRPGLEQVTVTLTGPVQEWGSCPAEHETMIVLRNVYEGLAGLDRDLRPVPLLAVSWENPSPTEWVFRLREGVCFHDGRPVAARDAADSILAARSADVGLAREQLEKITRVEVPDSRTVRLVTAVPVSELVHVLTLVGVVPGGKGTGVGTGPYRLAAREAGRLVLERFEGYWGPRPALKRLVFVVLGPRETPAEFARARGAVIFRDAGRFNAPLPKGMTMKRNLGNTLIALGFNVNTPPFDDIRLRRAVALAVDRPALARRRFGDGAVPVCQPLPLRAFGFDPAAACPPDPAAARRILEEAGMAPPLALDLHCSPKAAATMELLKGDLAGAGMDLRIHVEPWGELYPRITRREAGFFVFGYAGFCSSGLFMLDNLLATRGSFNPFGYSDPGFDALMDRAYAALSDAKRLPLLQAAARHAEEDCPFIPLYNLYDTYGVSDTLDWSPRPDGLIFGADIRPR